MNDKLEKDPDTVRKYCKIVVMLPPPTREILSERGTRRLNRNNPVKHIMRKHGGETGPILIPTILLTAIGVGGT
ncbi:hypothetical protein V6N13_060897 [Hibiscus sabdariffa]|uniref:Uncharacterized protein n=1 Tax=Hibiscus sabdariffa TaxID=183260 RepID=A0ABR2B150_9ROSI